MAKGERTSLYGALEELSCPRCCDVIREGELFTREVEPASGRPLIRLCCGCASFDTGGGLRDALLAPGVEESRQAAAPGDARENVTARLGPASAAGRGRG